MIINKNSYIYIAVIEPNCKKNLKTYANLNILKIIRVYSTQFKRDLNYINTISNYNFFFILKSFGKTYIL